MLTYAIRARRWHARHTQDDMGHRLELNVAQSRDTEDVGGWVEGGVGVGVGVGVAGCTSFALAYIL